MRRQLLKLVTVVSLLLFLLSVALWVRTEALGRTDTISWGDAGVYRSVELSSDDAEYKVLWDGGFPQRPLRWQSRRGGWHPPPAPSNPAAVPGSTPLWVLPQPNGQFMPAWRFLSPVGIEAALFPAWYGPGTALYSYRLSYFTVMLPAAVLPGVWAVKRGIAWYRRRFAPGRCRQCGYDLRATPERCPECGTAPVLRASSLP